MTKMYRRYSIILYLLFIGMLLYPVASLSKEYPPQTMEISVNNFSKPSASIVVYHDPIYISGDGNFTPSNGIVGGNGTKDDPYIIDGWKITGVSEEWAIYLEFTTKYCVIQNVEITGIQGGIFLNETDHVTIQNCYLHDIHGLNGFGATIFGPAGHGKPGTGIKLYYSNNTRIRDNEIDTIQGGHGGMTFAEHENEEILDGGSGEQAAGIYSMIGTTHFLWIKKNIIRKIIGGMGRDGGDGADAVGAFESGTNGGWGGNGGKSYGIFANGGYVYISHNQIASIWPGNGGSGGNGGDPGSAAGEPGSGGAGRDSGRGYGIYLSSGKESEIKYNNITEIHQARGGDGGSIGNDIHNTGYISYACFAGDNLPVSGISVYTIESIIQNNRITALFDNYTGVGGYTGDGFSGYGESFKKIGLYIVLFSDGIVSENLMYDFHVNDNPDLFFGLIMDFWKEGKNYLNHIAADWNIDCSNIYSNMPHYGNYYEQNPLIVDLEPKDGISDYPLVVNPAKNITDYCPLAYPLTEDADEDGVSNLDEYRWQTRLDHPDTDGDQIPDKWEITHGFDPCSAWDSLLDHDCDGLNLALEYYYGTNYTLWDTDRDGWSDEEEIRMKTDPLDATDPDYAPSTATDSETSSNIPNDSNSDTSITSENQSTNSQESSFSILGYQYIWIFVIIGVISLGILKKRKIFDGK